jgi:hypothetical protein
MSMGFFYFYRMKGNRFKYNLQNKGCGDTASIRL